MRGGRGGEDGSVGGQLIEHHGDPPYRACVVVTVSVYVYAYVHACVCVQKCILFRGGECARSSNIALNKRLSHPHANKTNLPYEQCLPHTSRPRA